MESQALLQEIRSTSATEVVEKSGALDGGVVSEVEALLQACGLKELRLVHDLPIVTTTFGFTRRSFEPTYEELNHPGLPTALRPFPHIDAGGASAQGDRDVVGKRPILAREAEHEGLLMTLDEGAVAGWLGANGIHLDERGPSEIRARILNALEPVDRYHDDIWQCTVRRYVFGLIHSLSHAAMRALSTYAGLDRSSVAEYIFMPLLGSVIYDNSSSFRLGGIESVVQSNLVDFLEHLLRDGVTCLYDPDCQDRNGACHACLHSPEISCRVFNHGLSRAFLIGGQRPWIEPTQAEDWMIGLSGKGPA